MHTPYLPQLLTLLDPVETYCTILVLHRRSQKPPDTHPIGLLVLLVEEVLVKQPQSYVDAVVEHRIVNGTSQQRILPQLRMLLTLQPLVLLSYRHEQPRREEEEVVSVQEGGFADVDAGLLELPVLVLQQHYEEHEDQREEEERRRREGVLIDVGIHEERNVARSYQNGVDRDQLHLKPQTPRS
jgi:hypothetical protein